jgi:hypothetical protein
MPVHLSREQARLGFDHRPPPPHPRSAPLLKLPPPTPNHHTSAASPPYPSCSVSSLHVPNCLDSPPLGPTRDEVQQILPARSTSLQTAVHRSSSRQILPARRSLSPVQQILRARRQCHGSSLLLPFLLSFLLLETNYRTRLWIYLYMLLTVG